MTKSDLEKATIEGAVQRLRPKLMTVTAVVLSLAPILWEIGHRLGRDEAHRRADRRRNDYIHDSRADPRSGLLSAHQARRTSQKCSRCRGYPADAGERIKSTSRITRPA